jgi:glutathione synthase/RimK-type ligase-like ATP-grasp enzyme
VEKVKDCRALLWHHSHSDPQDILIARQLLFAIEHAGLTVFPDFRTAWHFDDKVGQKYLFEALDIPRLPTSVFVEKKQALEWASTTNYPKVFKLRHGASSSCVRIVHNKSQARRLIRRAFGRGLPVYSPWNNLRDRIYKWRLGESGAIELAKGLGRFFHPPRFSKVLGRQTGYVLFQDFAPDNDSDLRITVIGDKAWGVRRWVRPGDFRASGSQRISHGREHVDIEAVALAFRMAKKLGSSCLACDFVRNPEGGLVVVEVSYGFVFKGNSPGFWDSSLNWHARKFRPEYWMVDLVLDDLDRKR